MKNWKDILLHSVPVAILALGSIFGLTAEEQNGLTQAITAVIGAIFAIMAIVVHHKTVKKP